LGSWSRKMESWRPAWATDTVSTKPALHSENLPQKYWKKKKKEEKKKSPSFHWLCHTLHTRVSFRCSVWLHWPSCLSLYNTTHWNTVLIE
jgi:hypothetical protein